MRKLTVAGLFLAASYLPVQAQVKPVANNHVTTVSATSAGKTTGTRARVLGREPAPASATPSPAKYSETAKVNPAGSDSWENRSLSSTQTNTPSIRPQTTLATRDRTALAQPNGGSTHLYRIGVRDVLDIQLPQSPTRHSTLFTVLDNGTVDYPLAGGPIVVVGLTSSEVADRLKQKIKVLKNPVVAVKVRDYASHTVTVNGFVAAPGVKILRREAVPLYVLLAEAMVLPEASRVTVTRNGKITQTINLADAQAGNTLILPGDSLRVMTASASTEFFFAGGEVLSPGQKNFHAGLTLTQAIMACGGLTKNAGQVVRISRQGSDGRLIAMDYNLALIQSGRLADPILLKGDRVEVRAR